MELPTCIIFIGLLVTLSYIFLCSSFKHSIFKFLNSLRDTEVYENDIVSVFSKVYNYNKEWDTFMNIAEQELVNHPIKK